MPRPFAGEIKLDVRESTPDWESFLSQRAPERAPNVLVLLRTVPRLTILPTSTPKGAAAGRAVVREARANNVFPLSDLGASGAELEKRLALEYHVPVPPSGQYTYYPGTTEVPEHSAANTHAVSFKILAEVEFTGDSQGVIVAQGSRFGGYSLWLRTARSRTPATSSEYRPRRVFRRLRPRSGRHIVGVEFTKERVGERRESQGPLKLYIDNQVVAEPLDVPIDARKERKSKLRSKH
jgi:hypothetical protein